MRWRPDPRTSSLAGLLVALLTLVGSASTSPAAHAEGVISGYGRHLQFAGYDWRIKTSNILVGPGPNYFSDSPDSVWTDGLGHLHLKVMPDSSGHWQAAEVVLQASLGYGTYHFYLDPISRPLDPSLVLGLFTWNDDPSENHRELDIELARWGQPNAPNGRYSVQPFEVPNHIFSFDESEPIAPATQMLVWQPGRVAFQGWTGWDQRPDSQDAVIARHVFTDGIPQPGGEQVRMNLWLDGGSPPTDGQTAEVVIGGFEFTPDPCPASCVVAERETSD
ncbi:MAG TPA: hypothetical protein VF937_03145 [Chloroflexota bacterium]